MNWWSCALVGDDSGSHQDGTEMAEMYCGLHPLVSVFVARMHSRMCEMIKMIWINGEEIYA